MINYELIPKRWEKTQIGDLVHLINGKAFKSTEWRSEGVPIIRIQNLKSSKATFNYIAIDQEIEERYHIERGDLLFAWSGTPGTSFGAHLWKGDHAYLNQHIFKVIIFEGLNRKYLLYALNTLVSSFVAKAQGTAGLAHITKGEFESTTFPLPALNEQNRIVDKIEELLSDLDYGVSNLKLAQNQLKVYRQAMLKYAFEGKLTKQWRKNNNPEPAEKLLTRIKEERKKRYELALDEWKMKVKVWEKDGKKGKRPSRPSKPIVPEKPNDVHVSKKWELPNGWEWSQLGLVTFITKLAGFEYTKYVNYDEKGDLAVLKAENAGQNGFKKTNFSKIKSETVSHLKRSRLSGGELLIVFVGAGTGNVAVVPKNNNFFLGPNIGMARPDEGIDSKYLKYFYQSPNGRNILMVTVKAVAQPSLSMGTIRQSPLVMTSFEEQRQIVQIIETHSSIIDTLEDTIFSNLNKSEALRQSILKKAFEGKLVPQDPNDESAIELLKRIKEEKEKYLAEQKLLKKKAPKKIKKMSKDLSIEEVLKTSNKPMPAKEVWQQSKHRKDIEEFYSELKKIQQNIKEVKKGTESLLSLVK